ncbi:major facilitator superfamily transporter [Colletotrichum costaricense]|uniref:Major facilitator superfamily transporter n=1 Tax=Colletotrichum costaricense TaxID=1209916 RepID=A0AAI9YHD7_9PEZI|nr:major facilitator superfamily transporter [Colletotrichum costaricense]KAK1509321.1 major facilitator superfamily transporter [Colletotrichum costaricense]
MTWGYGTSFAVYQLYYQQIFHLPSFQIAWIGSAQLFLYFVTGVITGPLADAGYTTELFLGGSLASCFGMFATSLSTKYWQIMLAQGICTGLGGGFMFMPAVANVAKSVKQNLTLAMSLSACGSSVGAIVFSVILQNLVPRVGFPWAVRGSAFVALSMCIVGNLLLRPKKLQLEKRPLIDWKAFKSPNFLVFTAASFLIWFAVFTLLFYINSFARIRIGLSEMESNNFFLITNALAFVARPMSGIIADRYIGAINTFSFTSLVLGLASFGWIGVQSRASMYVFSCALGFVNGAAQGVFPAASSSLADDVTKTGSWLGNIYAVCGFATLAGPPTMGAIINACGGDYTWAQACFGLILIFGSLISLLAALIVGKSRREVTKWTKFFYRV